MLRACEKYLPWKGKKGERICEWVEPMAGMFHWIKVDYTKHPSFSCGFGNGASNSVHASTTTTKEELLVKLLEIEDRIFTSAVSNGVLVAKGSLFRAEKNTDTEMFFRTTFAAAPGDKVDEAIRRFGEAMKSEFGLA